MGYAAASLTDFHAHSDGGSPPLGVGTAAAGAEPEVGGRRPREGSGRAPCPVQEGRVVHGREDAAAAAGDEEDIGAVNLGQEPIGSRGDSLRDVRQAGSVPWDPHAGLARTDNFDARIRLALTVPRSLRSGAGWVASAVTENLHRGGFCQVSTAMDAVQVNSRS